jgi:psiF repeat-containing protein
MKTLWTAVFLSLFSLAAYAQQGGQAAQQQRTRDCNAQAGQKNLNGQARQSFVSSCLKGDPAVQPERMKSCSKQAGDRKLKSDARKKFMTECLRG